MLLSYGGVQIEVLFTNEVSREVVLTPDRTQYLMTRWVFDVIGYYNPAAMAYSPSDITQPPAAPGPSPPPERPLFRLPTQQTGMDAASTDSALRSYMMQPRMRLFVALGTEGASAPAPAQTPPQVMLDTPDLDPVTRTRLPSDARNGPTPLDFSIKRVHGDKTLLVHFAVECHTCETDQLDTTQAFQRSPVLANRYRMWSETDEDHFTVRVVEGEAFFRTDDLIKNGIFPDQFRWQVCPPCPFTFKRELDRWDPSPDGSSLRYRVVDREQAFGFDTGAKNAGDTAAATRLEFWETHGSAQPAVNDAIADLSVGLFEELSDFAIGSFLSVDPVEGRAILARGLRSLSQVPRAFLNFTRASMPTFYSQWLLRLWGNRDSNRVGNLQSQAFALLFARLAMLGFAQRDPFFRSTEFTLTHRLDGKFVELQCTIRRPPTTQAAALAVNAPLFNPATGRGIPQNETINFTNVDVATGLPVQAVNPFPLLSQTMPCPSPANARDVRNPGSPNPTPGSGIHANGTGTRGSYIGLMVAHAITNTAWSPGGVGRQSLVPPASDDPPVGAAPPGVPPVTDLNWNPPAGPPPPAGP